MKITRYMKDFDSSADATGVDYLEIDFENGEASKIFSSRGAPEDLSWVEEMLEEAYKQGLTRGFSLLNKE